MMNSNYCQTEIKSGNRKPIGLQNKKYYKNVNQWVDKWTFICYTIFVTWNCAQAFSTSKSSWCQTYTCGIGNCYGLSAVSGP